MKKFLSSIKNFLTNHYKLGLLITFLGCVISSIAAFYSKLLFFVAVFFLSSTFSFFDLIIYRTGKYPFLMRDTTWNSLRLKYSEEEAQKKYKEISLKRASVCFLIASLSFVTWAILEVILFLTNLLGL